MPTKLVWATKIEFLLLLAYGPYLQLDEVMQQSKIEDHNQKSFTKPNVTQLYRVSREFIILLTLEIS